MADVTCPECGAVVSPGARFCSSCGAAQAVADVEATGALTSLDALVDSGPQLPLGAAAPYAVLIVHRGPHEGTAFPLTPPVVGVGRGADQQVFLDDITVSRRHAELRLTDQGWRIADLGSLNGTYVNRQPVTEAVLTSGDEVQIGKYRFRFMSGPGGGSA